MNNKEFILDMMRAQGRAAALDLRARAVDMTGTAVIAEENKIPRYDNSKDYTSWAVGAPVEFEGQIYALLQPYNASYYPDTNPATVPALWRVLHTTDPLKAKAWAKPTSTSDMYLIGECMIYNQKTYKAVRDTVYSPDEYAADWEVV